jgi:flagellar biosynthesis chaperone FliJ
MTSSLEQLIQISKFKIDEKRRKVGTLREFSERIQRNLVELESEIDQEMAIQDQGTPPVFKQTYIRAAQERRTNFLTSLQKVEAEIEGLNEQLQELFAEMKRYELTHKKRQQTRKDTITRKQNQAMDEIAARRGVGAF